MKALVCELCGGNDFVKENGLFVCQHCGTKYTLEEARSLFDGVQVRVEGPVEVAGVASSENLLRRAGECEKSGDWRRALDYYNRVLDADPDNAEARGGIERIDSVIDSDNFIVELENDVYDAFVSVDGGRRKRVSWGCPVVYRLGMGSHIVSLKLVGRVDSARNKRKYEVRIFGRRSKYRMLIEGKKFVWDPVDALQARILDESYRE